jgi:hypothetical protein
VGGGCHSPLVPKIVNTEDNMAASSSTAAALQELQAFAGRLPPSRKRLNQLVENRVAVLRHMHAEATKFVPQKTVVAAPSTRLYKELGSFGWSQVERIVTLNVDLRGIAKSPLQAGDVAVAFEARAVALTVNSVEAAMYHRLFISDLQDTINPEECTWKLRSGGMAIEIALVKRVRDVWDAVKGPRKAAAQQPKEDVGMRDVHKLLYDLEPMFGGKDADKEVDDMLEDHKRKTAFH